MSKRNHVSVFNLEDLESKLDAIKTEYLRKKNIDNRMSFKIANLTLEGLHQLSLPVRNNNKNFESKSVFNISNWDFISKIQYYHLSGKILYIIPLFTRFLKKMIDNLDEKKDPTRYQNIQKLYNLLSQWDGGIELKDTVNKTETQNNIKFYKK